MPLDPLSVWTFHDSIIYTRIPNCGSIVHPRQLLLKIHNLFELRQKPPVNFREVENLFDGESGAEGTFSLRLLRQRAENGRRLGKVERGLRVTVAQED